ncbi:MAG: DUF1254 domain-containing protein, partial [Pseudomonadota bacterium]
AGVVSLLLIVGAVLFVRAEIPKYRAAFLYAYGPYEFTRSIQDFSGQREGEGGLFNAGAIRSMDPDWSGGAVLNRHMHNVNLTDYTLRTVTTPNNDTLYTSAVLELSQTPVEIIVPAVGERYLSIALMDIFTDQFAHIGPRETAGLGRRYWVVGPDTATNPPEGVSVIRATGNDVWFLARTFVSGRRDLEAARAAQQGIIVRPVDPDARPNPFSMKVTNIRDPENFVAVVNETLSRNPDHPQSARAAEFSSLGLGPQARLGPLNRRLWALVTGRAEAAISEQVEQQMSATLGWSQPPDNIGSYGEDDLTRAAIALIGFGALRRSDAIYYRMTRTQDGAALDGTQPYRMTLPANVPAQAFWSIALYAPDETGRFFFYKTATGRHSLHSDSDGLAINADGSITLEIGPVQPSAPEANWMPTPNGPFAAFFRLYLPEPEAVREGWRPPNIVPVSE